MSTTTFFDYYRDLPTRRDQKDLRHTIIQACKVEKMTFYSWIYRNDVPDEKNRLIIADILGRPVSELFPQKQNINN
jgi:hypothetical protein